MNKGNTHKIFFGYNLSINEIHTVESRYSANRYTAISVIARSACGPRFLQGEIRLIVRIFYS